jgi:hypothetical protein
MDTPLSSVHPNFLAPDLSVEVLVHYFSLLMILRAFEHFSVEIFSSRIKDSEFANLDSVGSIPDHVSAAWFQNLTIPSFEEASSMFLTAQYLYRYLDPLCPPESDEMESANHDSPFSAQEAARLRDLSLSLQIYCERIRLIFFGALSPDEFGNTCQFCGSPEMTSNHSFKLICSSCDMATDTCMYTLLPINVVREQVALSMRCPLCESCSTLRSLRETANWMQSNNSFMMCLFCSVPLVAI